MRILWYSVTPECSSGYGNATRNMVRWLKRQGHFVAIATKHPCDMRYRMWEETPVLEGTNIPVLNRAIMDGWNMDVCISLFDIWALKEPIKRLIPWVPIDTQNVSDKIIEKVKDTPMQIAMSLHGQGELKARGLSPEYAPIGFDPEIFHPKPEPGRDLRASLNYPGIDPDDMYLIGSVGLNYPDDRKGFVLLMQAFEIFHKSHDNARLYLHTSANKDSGINYARVAMELGIGDLVGWADQDRLWFSLYEEEILSEIYSGFDVFCLPTRGEGFGMPVVEAQACGVPVVVTDNTTGMELCIQGWLIKTDNDDRVFTGHNTWRIQPKPSEVVAALEKAYKAEVIPSYISDDVAAYRWENVWEKHWKPIMDKIAAIEWEVDTNADSE